jgi:hypothetical protein
MEPPAIPALDRDCGTCAGTGAVTPPEWEEWAQQATAAKTAWAAEHLGESWYRSPDGRAIEDAEPAPEAMCAECERTGRQVTDAGRELLAFLARHKA